VAGARHDGRRPSCLTREDDAPAYGALRKERAAPPYVSKSCVDAGAPASPRRRIQAERYVSRPYWLLASRRASVSLMRMPTSPRRRRNEIAEVMRRRVL